MQPFSAPDDPFPVTYICCLASLLNCYCLFHRCLSIPVTLHAALKHPSLLLGSKAIAALQAYNKGIEEFDRELSAAARVLSTENVVNLPKANMEASVPYLGMKRKRTD